MGRGGREGWRIEAPGAPINTRASSGRRGRCDDDLVNGHGRSSSPAPLVRRHADGHGRFLYSPLPPPLLLPLFLSIPSEHTTHSARYFGAALTRGRARARTLRAVRRRITLGDRLASLYLSRVARRGRSAAASAIVARGRERRRISIPPSSVRAVTSYPLSITRRGVERGELSPTVSSPPPSALRYRRARGSSASLHGLINARTAPLTTPSLRRRVSILYGSDERRTRRGGE